VQLILKTFFRAAQIRIQRWLIHTL